MNEITAILEAHSDGTIHLPVPAELRNGKIEITAILRPVSDLSAGIEVRSEPASLRSTPEMVQRREDAFAALRVLDPYREMRDPVEWQREIRQDRPVSGRD